ncbi:MAG: hypothetical protein NZM09_12060 [Ignavibacterium sp.]|nr:hypothetical protein [Ignavibacterium sp.]MDW8376409.1 hypothetical protein [Ignavibacteriales bacterium]
MRTFLTKQQQIKIAEFKKKNPKATAKFIAQKFGYTTRQVYNALHKFPDIAGIKVRNYSDENFLKKIAIWKVNHPEYTLEKLEQKFKVPTHVARYALQKFAGEAELGKATRKGRTIQTKIIADSIDHIETLKHQLSYCLAELENNDRIVISSRIDMLYKMIRLRVYLQDLEIESHIKRVDADVIAMIIKRFVPNATSDDIIKIYTEEFHKWQTHKGQQGKGF